ncbi:hypothetical protein MHSWG343_02530 [Candidatus Mycoplasma haematohominis]|uniref:Uncharacterized protein n=1 Tax=Candidatus Mycoplasma haematohominis TaxID=1494318 RepID=A0A478FQB0_9MOLU|nr:hypothetical protein MHSWG343_02530 [Candidatus Mycoplasma haemohominis]
MTTINIAVNAVSLITGTAAITYVATGESLDWTAVRVWDQFYKNLLSIEDLETNDENWALWAERWAALVHNTYEDTNTTKELKLKTDYWKNQVIKADSNNKLKEGSRDNLDKKKTWAKDTAQRKELLESVKKLQDECKWAYGRYINRSINWDRSWFKSLSRRATGEDKKDTDEENYKYWSDVYLACSKSGSVSELPIAWLTEKNVELYKQYYVPEQKTE